MNCLSCCLYSYFSPEASGSQDTFVVNLGTFNRTATFTAELHEHRTWYMYIGTYLHIHVHISIDCSVQIDQHQGLTAQYTNMCMYMCVMMLTYIHKCASRHLRLLYLHGDTQLHQPNISCLHSRWHFTPKTEIYFNSSEDRHIHTCKRIGI